MRLISGFAAALALALSGTPPLAAQDAPSAFNPAAPSAPTPAPALEARPPLIPTSAFAGPSYMRSSMLSPDGRHIITQMELNGDTLILLIDAVTLKPVRKFNIGKRTGLEWFRWASNDMMLVSASRTDAYFGEDALYTRLYVVNINSGEMNLLGKGLSGLKGDNLIHVSPDGAFVLMAMQATPYLYPSVYRFDMPGKRSGKEVQSPREGVWDWYADDKGVVRIGSGWKDDRLRVYYRRAESDKLELVGKYNDDDDKAKMWDVLQIISGSDQGYVLDTNAKGRVELQLFDYAKREAVETVYANPDWDVDAAYVAKDGKPLAAFYTDDRDRVVWFKPEDQKLQANLEKALAEDEVWVSSRSRDGSRMLIWAGGEADPGAMYVYTPAKRSLVQLASMRPSVPVRDLVKPKPVRYTARDGTAISAYLTLPRGREAKGLPLILLPHGGPYGIRDKLDYNDEVQLLANRGYAVLQPNFRGSGGYGDSFFELGTGQIGRKMQDDLDDAGAWAVKQGYADPARVCVVGSSYGGYAALWAAIRNPELYRCAASWAGVTDFDSQLKYDRSFFTRKGGKKWRARVEGDDDSFDLDSVSPYRQAGKLTRPILLAHGTEDSNVPFSQYKKMRKATQDAGVPVELLEIKDEGHSFTKPENEQLWYDTLLAFLARHNPAD